MPPTIERGDLSVPNTPKKACQIQIMFPVEDDKEAMSIKEGIDAVVGPIQNKRYTFNITEM